jgi:transposase
MKPTAQTRSYTGESVYVGIDVHKRTYLIVVRVNPMEVKRWTTAAEPENLGQQLHQFFPDAELHRRYEAGFSGFGLHRELQRQGVKSLVVHTAAIEVAANQRVKTDKRDARKIVEHLEAGRLRGFGFHRWGKKRLDCSAVPVANWCDSALKARTVFA